MERVTRGITLALSMAGLVGAVMILAAPGSATADETPALVVGVEELDYYPIYAMRDGQYTGAARGILDAFAADAGLRLVYQPLPIKRLYADLFTGAIDLKFPDNPTWNPDGKAGRGIAYSGAVLPFIDGTMVTPQRLGRGLKTFATLGTVSGFTPFAWFDTLKAGTVTTTENSQLPNLLRQTITGRVDGAYVNVAAARYQLRTTLATPDALVFDPGLPHSRGHYVVSSIKHHDVIAKLDTWLSTNADRIGLIAAGHGLESRDRLPD